MQKKIEEDIPQIVLEAEEIVSKLWAQIELSHKHAKQREARLARLEEPKHGQRK